MSRTLSASLLAFMLLWAALPCLAADLEAACAKFNSCYNGGGHDVCWRRQESQLLSKRDAKASRDGASLHVMTLRAPVIFTDTLDEEKYVDGALYRYLGYFPDIGQHLIGVVYYEGKNFILVSHSSAQVVETGSVPHVSPSRKRIVAANADEAYSLNEIRLWKLEGGKLLLEHSVPLEVGIARFSRWEDDAAFSVDEHYYSMTAECPKSKIPTLQCTYRWEMGRLSRNVAKAPRCVDY